MTLTVATSIEIGPAERAAITGGKDVDLLEVEREEATSVLPRAEVWFGPPLTEAELAAAPRLRWVQADSAGVDRYMASELAAAGIALTTAAGAHGEQASEHAFALILALAHRLPSYMDRQRRREWRDEDSASLAGATLLVVGLGAIGRHVARLGAAFSMRVLGVRRSDAGAVPGVERVWPAAELDQPLREADWVVLACPLTDETRHLVDARRLAVMRPTARLVNIARGAVVDEAALIQALARGALAGAGLDVFEEEPLPPSSPLWELPNVIVTPHVAGSHPGYTSKVLPIFVDNLDRFLAGRPLRNRVEPGRGY